jgi:hypothetical protein
MPSEVTGQIEKRTPDALRNVMTIGGRSEAEVAGG